MDVFHFDIFTAEILAASKAEAVVIDKLTFH